MSIQLAEQFEANEQYDKALEEYKAALEADPQNIGILERLGHLSLILEKPQEAAGYYYQMLQLDVTNPLAYDQLISIYENTDRYQYYVYRGNKNSVEGKLEFAINDFKKALAHANDNDAQIIMTRLTLANIYRQTGNILKAIDEFNVILEYDNLNEDIFLQFADIYVQDEAYPSAIDVLQRAIQKGFDSKRIREAIAAVYLKNGNAAEAIQYTSDELLKIQCMLEQGQIDEAYSKLNSLNDEYKKFPRYYILQAQYCYSTKDFEKALDYINEYNKLAQNSPLTYQMRALVYEELKDNYNAYLNWGKYNVIRKNRDIAINEFINAVQIKDTDIELLFTLAQLLTENGDTNHATEYYERIVSLEPNNKEALKKLADFRESIGDYKKQVEYLEDIYVADKSDMNALKNLAKGYEKIKAKDKAIQAYNKYLERVTDGNEYTLIKEKIEKLDSSYTPSSEESDGLIGKIMSMFKK